LKLLVANLERIRRARSADNHPLRRSGLLTAAITFPRPH
jgi:hypothetical protein